MNVLTARPLLLQTLSGCLLCLLIFCTACSGGSTSTGGGSTPITPTAPAAASTIYFPGYDTNNVYIFPTSGTGTLSPTSMLTVPQQYAIYSVATDSSGRIYVGVNPNAVLVFPAGSTGASTPTRTIPVPAAPFNLYVDPTGLLYVAMGGIDTVNVYASNASGTSTPVRTFTPPNFQAITDVTTDVGGNTYIAGEDVNDRDFVNIYNSTTQGASTPTRMIGPYYLFGGLATDASSNLYASTYQPNAGALVEFPANASGAATPSAIIPLDYSINYGAIVGGLRRDAAGNIFMALVPGVPNSNNVTVLGFKPPLTNSSTPFVSLTVNAPQLSFYSLALK